MTKISNLKYKEVGEIYKIRAYKEQGFRNSKNELGWVDFRLTKNEGKERPIPSQKELFSN